MMQQIKHVFKLLILVCSLFSFIEMSACRYTVREIGYTDLGNTEFHLYMFVTDSTSKETIESFEQVGYAMLMDTNVKIEVVNIDQNIGHPALEFISVEGRDKDKIELLLVSPNGSSKLISSKKSFVKDDFWNLMEEVINSEIRTKMTQDLAVSYGALLLVEGIDPNENKRALAVAKQAMAKIHKISNLMAKPVDVPVRLYVLPYNDRGSEELLLWSLGVSLVDEAPSLVTLFGRGRMMGAPLVGRQIHEKEAFKLLSIIGADCECGLERKWILGSSVPFRWDMETRNLLTKELGFDVENPMVKSEMSQILSIDLAVIEKISTTTYVNSLESAKTVNKSEKEANESSVNNSTNYIFGYSLLGVFVIIIIAGGFMYFVKKQSKA